MEILRKIKIDSITPYNKNPRKNDKAVPEVIKSIGKVGYRTPIIVDENNVILCGHTRYKALIQMGWTHIPFVVKYDDLTDEKKQEYRIMDNKTGEIAEWDFELLQIDFSKEALVELGFDIKDLKTGEIIEDEAPSVPETARTVKGDIYTLGNHRLLCGDSTILSDIENILDGAKPCLLFTDPLYGVSIGKKNELLDKFDNSNRNKTNIANDDLNPEKLKEILTLVMSNMKIVCADDCTYFVTAPHIGELSLMTMIMMKDSGLPVRHVLMWLKNSPTFSLGRLDYDYQHEPILLTWTKKHKSIMAGQHRTSVWKIDKPQKSKEHPTMKPVALYVNALLNNSETGDYVIDPFGGSGTMIIAAEQTNRKAYSIELSEHYCDVIVQRWVNLTGGKVIRNGQEIDW